MKSIISIFISLFVMQFAFSQNQFIYKQSSSFDDFFVGFCKNTDSLLYVLSIQQSNLSTNSKARSVIHKLDYYGNLIDTIMLTDFQENISFNELLVKDSFIYLFGSKQHALGVNNVFIKYDLDFNKLSEKHMFYDTLLSQRYISDIVVMDTVFYIINYDWYYSEAAPSFSILKVSNNFDSLGVFISHPNNAIAYKGLANRNNTNFKIFTYMYMGIGWGQSVSFDKNLNTICIDTLPDLLHQFNDALWVSDSTYLVTGITRNTRDSVYIPNLYDWDMGFVVLDINNNQIEYKYQYRLGSKDSPGWGQNFIQSTVNNKEYYFTGTINRPLSIFDTSVVVLTKLDSNYNVIWEKHISDSIKSLDVSGIYNLDDGSIILLIWEFEDNVNWYRDAYIYKISMDGEVLFITKLFAQNKINLNIFPNPTSDFVNIELHGNMQIVNITIYNINGKQVLHQQINSQQTKLNVSSLASGIYIIEGYTQDREVFREKFVVE